MTLIELTNKIKQYAENQYNHPKAMEGSVYTNLNTKELTYPCINIDNVNVVKRDNEVVYSYYVYYADRLNEDGSNTLQVQSEATTSLELILNKIAESGAMNLDEIPNVIITPYKMKFTDMCAGAWMQVSIHTLNGIDYCNDGSTINTLYVTANGRYDAEGYDAVSVDVPQTIVGTDWFYMKSREDGSKLNFNVPSDSSWTVSLEYSTNKIDWNTWDFSELTLNSGDTVYFRGNNPNGLKFYCFGTPRGTFNIGGDIRSLIDKTITVTTPPEWGFASLFQRCNIVKSDKKLLSGFSALSAFCFYQMFSTCGNLTQAPDLPWETLEGECYSGMFFRCTSLTTAPYIGVTALSNYMPFNCMFKSCTSLNYIKCLISNPNSDHFQGWVDGVSPTGTFVKAANSEWVMGTDGIPEGWTIKDSEIELIDTAITTNGTYTAEVGKGYHNVVVDVPTGITPTGSITLNDNGTYDVTNKATAIVNVEKDNRLKITAKAANSTVGLENISSWQTIEVSADGENWSGLTTGTTYTLVNSGDSLYVRGILTADNEWNNWTKFAITGNVKVSGNLNYLWNYNDLNAQIKEYCGKNLFWNQTAVTDVSEMVFPAMTLAQHCYEAMFYNCPIAVAPELPATALSSYCYWGMFEQTGLVRIPDLPAMTMATGCYYSMFAECTGLTSVPALLSLTLAPSCYRSMYKDCSNLVNAPELPATTLVNGCYAGMFNGCVRLVTAPDLPAQTLVEECYQEMFNDCSGLTYIKCLATDTSATNCINMWVRRVNSNGTFVGTGTMNAGTYYNNYQGYPETWAVKREFVQKSKEVHSNGVYIPNTGEAWTFFRVNVPTVTTQTLTQEQYDALQTKDPMVIYLITE